MLLVPIKRIAVDFCVGEVKAARGYVKARWRVSRHHLCCCSSLVEIHFVHVLWDLPKKLIRQPSRKGLKEREKIQSVFSTMNLILTF